MDSHLIYTVANRLLYYVVWKETDNHGWVYCGLSSDLKRDLLKERVNKNFQDKKIYIVLNRKDTRELDISEAPDAIASNIDKHDFSLWSRDFKHVMTFNKIGIFRVLAVSPLLALCCGRDTAHYLGKASILNTTPCP